MIDINYNKLQEALWQAERALGDWVMCGYCDDSALSIVRTLKSDLEYAHKAWSNLDTVTIIVER